MEEHRRMIQWAKEHKKELIIAGIGVGALILIILGIRNKATVKAVWNSMKEHIRQPSTGHPEAITRVVAEIPPAPAPEVPRMLPSNSPSLPFEVRRHVRELPKGWHASPEKIATAAAYNIELLDGQTWVDSYTKGGFAA